VNGAYAMGEGTSRFSHDDLASLTRNGIDEIEGEVSVDLYEKFLTGSSW